MLFAPVCLVGLENRRWIQEEHGQQLPSESLAELVLQRAAANPSAFAVIGPEGVCTYGEILRRAELFASYLCDFQPSRTSSQSMLPLDLENPLLEETSILENQWNEENQFIGLMVSPGPWMLAGPLGAWMAGHGYFALDTSHPLERIQQMTQDASPQCVFTERKNQSLANSLGWPSVFVEDLAMQRRERYGGYGGYREYEKRGFDELFDVCFYENDRNG